MNIKNLIKEEIENFQQEKRYSPEEIYQYINKSHKSGWEKRGFDDDEWVFSHKYFILKDVNLNDPDIKWNFGQHLPVVKQYSKLETDIPAIVIGSNGYIIDGTHRAGAAKQKGNSTIKAFIGI